MTAFWDSLYGGLRSIFWYAIKWLLGYGSDALQGVIDVIAFCLPLEYFGVDTALLKAFLKIANAWIPLDLASGMLLCYLGLRITILTVRMVIKLIPTIG